MHDFVLGIVDHQNVEPVVFVSERPFELDPFVIEKTIIYIVAYAVEGINLIKL